MLSSNEAIFTELQLPSLDYNSHHRCELTVLMEASVAMAAKTVLFYPIPKVKS